MTGILKVDQWKDSGDNALMTSDGAGTLTANVSIASFSSTGIDDNATSTAVTIDSSENVLVKKTSVAYQTVGHELKSDGRAFHTADGGKAMSLVRKNSDGSILDFYIDGTEEGSIQVAGGGTLALGAGNTFLRFQNSDNTIRPTSNSGFSNRDNAIDLGASNARWNDLYLGGNIYLGGTGSANALNDYEEGSFTPSLDIETGSNISVSTIQGYYRKIGNLVAFTIFCVWDKTAGSANMKFTGLPFTCSNQTNLSSQAVNWLQGAYTDQGAFFGGRVFGSSTDVYFVDSKHGSFNSNFDTNNAGRIANTTGIRTYVNGTYFTT